MPEHFVEQGTPEWHELRKGRITASIAAACLGLDPNKSRQWAWREILGTNKEYKENRHQAWGHEKEPLAAADYEVITGNMIQTTGFWTHPHLHWLGASPDRKAGRTRLAEIKAPQKLPTAIPVPHAIQMMVQIACCTDEGFDHCDYFAWHSMDSYFMDSLNIDSLLLGVGDISAILFGLEEFREKYVLRGIEPERKTREKKNPIDRSETLA
jgi:putative phage-type endonuclease